MQGGGRPWLRILAGAADIVSIDARPLMLAFAICGGAASYFALPAEPELALVLSINAVLIVVFLAARQWSRSETVIMLTIVMLGGSLGVTAGAVRSLTSAAPVIGSETGPVMLEGWIQEIEPGQKGVRLNIRVHSISGMSPSDWPLNVRVTHMSRLEVSPGRFVRCWSVCDRRRPLRCRESMISAGRPGSRNWAASDTSRADAGAERWVRHQAP